MSERWACGLYDEGGRKLFVTGGVGVSILPVRFRAPPEIVILTLKRSTPAPVADSPDLINDLCVPFVNSGRPRRAFGEAAVALGGRRLETGRYAFPGRRSVALEGAGSNTACTVTWPGDQAVRLRNTAFSRDAGYNGWGGSSDDRRDRHRPVRCGFCKRRRRAGHDNGAGQPSPGQPLTTPRRTLDPACPGFR